MTYRNRIGSLILSALVAFGAATSQADPATPPAGSIYVSTTGANTNDGLTPATPVKTISAGIQKAFETIPTTTGSANNANIWPLFDAAVRWADNTATPVTSPNNKAAVIVRTLNMSNRTPDRLVVLEMERLGYEVQVVAGNQCTGTDPAPVFNLASANSKNIIVICNSVAENDVNNLRASSTPKVDMNSATWDNFGIVGGTTAGVYTTYPNGTQLTVSDIATLNSAPGNALVAGDTTVYSKAYEFASVDTGVTALQPGVVAIANVTGAANQVCMLAADTSVALSTAAGAPAGNNPARFVGFFLFGLRLQTTGSTIANDFTDANTIAPPATNVVVAAGNYPITYALGPFRNLKIQGGWNATFDDQISTRTTTVDAQLVSRLVYATNGSSTYSVTASNSAQSSDSGNPERSLCDYSTFDSLTLTNGSFAPQSATTAAINNFHAGGILIDGSPMNVTFSHCTISNCVGYDRGGAIFANTNFTQNTALATTDRNATFDQCVFTGNTTAGTGTNQFGSIYGENNGPGIYFSRCLMTGNTTPAGSTGSALILVSAGGSRTVNLSNCIISNNNCQGTNARLIQFNGAEAASRIAAVRNCTIVGNTMQRDLIYMANSSNNPKFVDISNNIFANNTTTNPAGSIILRTLNATTSTADTFTVRNNLTFNNTGFTTAAQTATGDMIINGSPDPAAVNVSSSGNFQADPLFVNAAGGNYHLQDLSPGINAGASLSGLVTTDYDGLSRPKQGIFDIGAFEHPASLTNAVDFWTIY